MSATTDKRHHESGRPLPAGRAPAEQASLPGLGVTYRERLEEVERERAKARRPLEEAKAERGRTLDRLGKAEAER